MGLVTNSAEVGSNSIEYTIHDSTGTITGRYYTTNGAEMYFLSSHSLIPRYSHYVKIIGSLRMYSGRISLSIHAIMPVLNFNEVTSHYLSAIHCYLYMKKQANGGMMNSNAMAMTTSADPMAAAMNGYGAEMSPIESKVGVYGLWEVSEE